jgi:hypothetical protein
MVGFKGSTQEKPLFEISILGYGKASSDKKWYPDPVSSVFS